MKQITKHIDQITILCQENKVKYLIAVGSVTYSTDQFNTDVDLLVEIEERDPLSYIQLYRFLKLGLESLLLCNVNLLEPSKIKNSYLKEKLDKTRIFLYIKM